MVHDSTSSLRTRGGGILFDWRGVLGCFPNGGPKRADRRKAELVRTSVLNENAQAWHAPQVLTHRVHGGGAEPLAFVVAATLA